MFVCLLATRKLVDLFEQLLDVIFNLFDLPGVGALALTIINKAQYYNTLLIV